MSIELKIPEVGESITEVQIARWLKAEGDAVQKDEPVAVIDSEKTTFELPAPEGGRLGKILHQAGATVRVGDVIGQLEPGSGGTAPAQARGAQKTPAKPEPTTPASKPKASAPTARESAASTKSSRPSRSSAVAKESEPSAPAGGSKATNDGQAREVAPSSERKAAPERAATDAVEGEEEIVPMSMLRRTVARRLVEAKQQMAMLTTFNEVDMSVVQALRHEHGEAFEKRHQVRLGLMSFFAKAAVDALKQYPQLNAEIREHDIVYRNYFNLGVAMATPRGLVVPVLRRAERLSFAEVEKSIGAFAARARDGQLKPEDLEGATFTITNGGVFGSLLSTPIINPPQSGILGLHTIQERPVAVQGQVVIRPMMYVALTYDHRLVDGREAVLFLRRIKEAIEAPARMLIEI